MTKASLVTACVLLLACTADDPGPQPGDRVDAYFGALAAADRFSGVVLIADEDQVVLEEGYGWADVEHRVALDKDSILRIGSLTKPITASLVMLAVKDRLVTVDDQICEYIPDLPEPWCPTTVRQLLSHTSGIPDLFGELEEVPVEDTAAELTRMLGALEEPASLETSPGSEYSYSNFNYVLLGVMLEAVYDKPWNTALDDLLFRPLELASTAYDDVWSLVTGRARGYRRSPEGTLRHVEYSDHAAYAAGGLYSTAHDLFVWSERVFSTQLMGPELTSESLTPVLGTYGYGWQVRDLFDRRMINHTGGVDGFSSHLAYYPDEQVTFIVLSNVENDSAFVSACDAATLWFDTREPPSDPLAWLELENRQRCGIS